MADPEHDRWWPGVKIRAILFLVGCALVAVAWLVQPRWDSLVAGWIGGAGAVLALVQFTFGDDGID